MEALKVFLSHKTGTHGNSAKVLANILREVSDDDKLKIFVSPELGAGTVWSEEIHEELKQTDILIVLYLAEGENIKMGWCDYEAGFFAGITAVAEHPEHRIIPVLRDGAVVQGPLSKYEVVQVNEKGVNKLLRTIFDFDDPRKKVKPHIFDVENKVLLDQLTSKVIDALKAFMRDTISPRLWISIDDGLLPKIRNDELLTEEEMATIHLRGETEALRDFGIGAKDGIEYDKFYEQSSYKRSLDLYIPHLMNAIRNILSENYDKVFVPPLRITESGYARTLVPASIERLPNNRTRFEFLSYKPIPSFNVNTPSEYDYLFNVFVLSWRFRWSIINRTLSELLDKKSFLINRGDDNDIRQELKTVKDRMSLILLDALNRGIDFPRRISKIISKIMGEKVTKTVEEIIDIPDGSWYKCSEQIFHGIKENNLEIVIDSLNRIIPLNKKILEITLNCLLKATNDLEDKPQNI